MTDWHFVKGIHRSGTTVLGTWLQETEAVGAIPPRLEKRLGRYRRKMFEVRDELARC